MVISNRRCARLREWLRKIGCPIKGLIDQDDQALDAFAHLASAWNRGASEHHAVNGMAACVALIQQRYRYLALLGLACFSDWPAIGKLWKQLLPLEDSETFAQLVRVLHSLGQLEVAGLGVRIRRNSDVCNEWRQLLPLETEGSR